MKFMYLKLIVVNVGLGDRKERIENGMQKIGNKGQTLDDR